MKKLALVISLVVAAPVFACPSMDAKKTETAENKKEAPAPAKAEQPKQDTAKAPAKTADAKKPEKVSAK